MTRFLREILRVVGILLKGLKRVLESNSANAIVVGLMLVSLAFTLVVQFEVKAHDKCISRWADKVSSRSDKVGGATSVLITSLNAVMRTIPEFDRAKFEKALTVYLVRAKDYDTAQKKNPVPPPPELRC